MPRSSLGSHRGRVLTAAVFGLAALVLALGPGGTSTAAGGKDKSHTKVTATASKPDSQGRQTITITMDIEKPWYAYANPVGFEELENAQTTVKIASKGGKLEEVKITYPPGKEKTDSLLKANYKIYLDKVTITGQVRRAKGDTSPLEVSVTFMNCHPKGMCLPPETVKFSLK
jgi:thiol:disulfide interchange protein